MQKAFFQKVVREGKELVNYALGVGYVADLQKYNGTRKKVAY